MKWNQYIKHYWQRYVEPMDRVVLTFVGINFFLGFYFYLLNGIFTHYYGNLYIPISWLYFLPLMLLLLIVGMWAKQHSPKMGFFTRTYTIYFLLLLSFAALATGVQFTPFPTIDFTLVKIDQAVGFSTPAIMQWTNQHPEIKKLFEICYDALDFELFIIPLIAVFFKERRFLDHFLMMIALGFLMACLIYYFMPTAAPVSVFTNVPFLPQEHFTARKFYEVHHYLPITVHDTSLIAFPSMHVIWAVCLLYLVRKKKWLFIPLFVLNSLVILSTLFLGWHYLTDVVAGFIVMALSAYLANRLYVQNKL